MKARKIFLAMMTIASVMLFNACEEDPCEGVTCSGNGTPVETLGSCSCDCDVTTSSGYYGTNCENFLNCLNNGTFNGSNNTCTCIAGYEGDSCQTLSRDKFIGRFDVTDACSSSGAATYEVEIVASGIPSEHAKVFISNFWDSFTSDVEATINGSTITIPTQEPDNDGFTVTGTGTISGDAITITVNYSVADGTDTDVCQSTWEKK